MARYAVTMLSLPARVTGTSLVHFAERCNASREKAFRHFFDIDRMGTGVRSVFFLARASRTAVDFARSTIAASTLRNVVKDS